MSGHGIRAIALALLAALGAAPAFAEGKEIAWLKDFEAAKKQAAEVHKLVMVNFWAEW